MCILLHSIGFPGTTHDNAIAGGCGDVLSPHGNSLPRRWGIANLILSEFELGRLWNPYI